MSDVTCGRRVDCAIQETIPPLDYSFLQISEVGEVLKEEPRASHLKEQTPLKGASGKSLSRCLRLNNNSLSDIKALPQVVSTLFENPDSLGWIDLCFNELATIDNCLTTFVNLEILYLHGNLIADLQEVDKLVNLRRLRKLTLHGNVIESVKGYKWRVLELLPWLLNFDFCAVTKADRRTASIMERFTMAQLRNKRTKKDEDD